MNVLVLTGYMAFMMNVGHSNVRSLGFFADASWPQVNVGIISNYGRHSRTVSTA
jgi:hypothetical protein